MTDTPSARTLRIGRMFDEIAGTYDDVGVEFFQPIAAGLLDALAPAPGERWLDIGCGAGAVLLPAARAVQPGGRAVGIDLSAEMLKKCRARAHAQGIDVELALDDAQAPEVEGQYDVVSSSLVLFFLPDPTSALRSWRALASHGARLGVTTFGADDPRLASVDALFLPHLPQDMLDARTSGASGPFASDAGVEALVAEGGWTNVRTVQGQVPIRFDDLEAWHRWSFSTGQRQMWRAVPEEARDGLRDKAFELLSEDADPDGSITYWQQVRHTLATAH